jgi:uncharacterized membrane protein YeaQ/YmgE (transglycosylase-associated protein family)
MSLLLSQARVDTGDDRGLIMSIIIWLFIGLVAGFLASKIVNRTGEGLVRDIILGLIGSFVGGLIMRMVGFQSGGGILISIVVATLGAILVLVIYHKLIRGAGPGSRTMT